MTIKKTDPRNMALHFSATKKNHKSKVFNEDVMCKNLQKPQRMKRVFAFKFRNSNKAVTGEVSCRDAPQSGNKAWDSLGCGFNSNWANNNIEKIHVKT